MLIPATSTLRQEDFDSEERKWIGKLLGPLNQFIIAAVQAVNGNITHSDNIPCQLINLTFVYGGPNDFPKKIAWSLPQGTTPTEVRTCKALENGQPIAIVPAWNYANGNITFSYFSKLTNAAVVPLTVGATYSLVFRGLP